MFEQSSTARLSCEENRCVCEKVLTLGHSIGTGSTLWHHMHWGTCAVQLSGSIVTSIMEEAVMKVLYDQHLQAFKTSRCRCSHTIQPHMRRAAIL